MATPAEYDMTIRLGTVYRQPMTYELSDGTPIDITGGALTGKIKASKTEGAALILDLTPYLSITDPVNGEALLLIPSAITQQLGEDNATYCWAYDIFFTPSGGDREDWMTGSVTGSLTMAAI